MYDEDVKWDQELKEPWELRLGFITKVYGILLSQLIFTAIIAFIIFKVEVLQDYLVSNLWPLILCLCLSFAILIALICYQKLARQVPTNYILLFAFTFCEAVLVGIICSFYDPLTVFIAVIMTLQVTAVLTIYAMTTHSDFTTCRAFMAVVAMTGLLFTLMMCLFYSTRWMEVLLSAVWCIIYGLYIIIDTQSIIGKHKYSISYDDYILGAVCLYIDIIGLFLELLTLLGKD